MHFRFDLRYSLKNYYDANTRCSVHCFHQEYLSLRIAPFKGVVQIVEVHFRLDLRFSLKFHSDVNIKHCSVGLGSSFESGVAHSLNYPLIKAWLKCIFDSIYDLTQ